jgi:hypothetical protein
MAGADPLYYGVVVTETDLPYVVNDTVVLVTTSLVVPVRADVFCCQGMDPIRAQLRAWEMQYHIPEGALISP